MFTRFTDDPFSDTSHCCSFLSLSGSLSGRIFTQTFMFDMLQSSVSSQKVCCVKNQLVYSERVDLWV